MKASYNGVAVPASGKAIEFSNKNFSVPDNPIIPFIEGDGTGRDIWRASQRVFDAAVAKAYGGKRKVAWLEIFAGEKAYRQFKEWLPQDSVDAIQDFRIAIKGPLTTPVGGGIRSLNVTLRQVLDLYACVRPVRYFLGVPSPVKNPERMNVVIFRENTEDVYAGIEWRSGTPEVKKLIEFLNDDMLKGGKKKCARIRESASSPCHRRERSVWCAARSFTRWRQAASGYVGSQRQHSKIHRRRVPRVGLRGGDAGISRSSVTERESWILGNKDSNPDITVEQNAALIEPGLDSGAGRFQERSCTTKCATRSTRSTPRTAKARGKRKS